MLPGDSELDKLVRKEALSFIELFNEAKDMISDYDNNIPSFYRERDNILIKFKELQYSHIELAQKINTFKQSLAQLRDKIVKIENDPPLWASLKKDKYDDV